MEKDRYLISIIIPVYNGEDTVFSCVNSVLQQSYKNIEIIIIDDGSDDGTYAVCKEKFLNENKVKIYRQKENRGVSAARNKGLALAQGDYIIFCDADDTMQENMLEVLLTYAMADGADIVCCAYESCNNWITVQKPVIMDNKREILFSIGKYGGFVWNKLFSKNIIADIKFDESLVLCEDMVFIIECVSKKESCKLEYISEKLYNYSKGGITAGASDKHFKKDNYCYEEAMLRAIQYAGEEYKEYYIHKTFMLAVVERDFDKRYHNLNNKNRLILKDVLKRTRKGFLLDKEILLTIRIITYFRYLFPYSKYLRM